MAYSKSSQSFCRTPFAGAVLATAVALAQGNAMAAGEAPVVQQAEDPLPVAIFAARPMHAMPTLGGTGKEGRSAVEAFLQWASASVPEERDDARQALAAMRSDKTVVSTLCRIGRKAEVTDGTKAMVAYALLGELRSDKGLRCLRSVVVRKAPVGGPVETESGKPMAELSFEQLQAKAVEGMAYHGTAESDAMVLDVIAKHPSRAVRAAAIDAWLWNHGDGPDARVPLLQVVSASDAVLLDRVRREEGESAKSFDTKLATFLALHPELVAPDPLDGDATNDKGEKPTTIDPPPDKGFRFDGTRPECASADGPTCNGSCTSGETCSYDANAGTCACITEVVQ